MFILYVIGKKVTTLKKNKPEERSTWKQEKGKKEKHIEFCYHSKGFKRLLPE